MARCNLTYLPLTRFAIEVENEVSLPVQSTWPALAVQFVTLGLKEADESNSGIDSTKTISP